MRVRRTLGLMSVALLVAAALAGCGSARDAGGSGTVATARTRPSSTRPATTTPARTAAGEHDVARARDALVRLADLPDGWTEQAGAVTRLHCGSFEPFGRTSALVRSLRLTQEHAGVQERIALYPTAADARRALRRLDSRTAAGCLRRELRRHVSKESGGPAGPAQLVRAEPLGPGAQARRYVSTSVSSYGKVVGYIDAVHIRVGRALGALVLVTGPSPPDEKLYERVVAVVTRRLRTTLG